MNIVNIILICFIGSGLTLTLITIRQRKANKYLKDLSSATKIQTENEYSALGIAIRDGEYLVKCPDCAEFIKLEANVCKNCRADIAQFTQSKREELSRVSKSNNLARQSQVAANKSTGKKIAAVVFLLLGSFLIINLVSTAISSSRDANTAANKVNAFNAEIEKWEAANAQCNYSFGFTKDLEDQTPMANLSMGISADETEIGNIWNTVQGKALDCFSTEILGFKLSTYFSVDKDEPNFQDRYLYDEEYTDVSFKGVVGSKNGLYNGYIMRSESYGITYLINIEWDYSAP
jgi:hypothetical protein